MSGMCSYFRRLRSSHKCARPFMALATLRLVKVNVCQLLRVGRGPALWRRLCAYAHQRDAAAFEATTRAAAAAPGADSACAKLAGWACPVQGPAMPDVWTPLGAAGGLGSTSNGSGPAPATSVDDDDASLVDSLLALHVTLLKLVVSPLSFEELQ